MTEFKMTDEQKELFDKLKPLQREIALNTLSGMNAIDSYRNSKGKAKAENTMRASVSEILANPNVIDFLDSMRGASLSKAIMTRDAMLEAQTKIANIGLEEMDSLSLESLSELKGALDIKLKAMNQIAELNGYKSAQKFDHTSSDGSMSPTGKTLDDFYSDSEK